MPWFHDARQAPAFHDKAWKRADLAAWDQRWAALSLRARTLYLKKIRATAYTGAARQVNDLAAFPAEIVAEWRQVGLIRDETSGRKTGFVVVDAAIGFTHRLQALHHSHLLTDAPGNLERFIYTCFSHYLLEEELSKVVQKHTGLDRYALGGNMVEMFVKRRRWPDWVAAYLADPLAEPLLAAVEQAGSVPLKDLPALLPGRKPADVRQTLDRLVNYLALVEDLDPATLDIVVGVLPSVRADRQKAGQKVVDKPLQPVAAQEPDPEGGPVVPDLRAVLLEIAGQPPRLKQNLALYQKEEARFEGLFDPPPDWLKQRQGDPASHLPRLLALANTAQLTHAVAGAGDAVVLDLTPAGRSWLAKSIEEQYAHLFEIYRSPPAGSYWGGSNDSYFLGSNITALAVKPGRQKQGYKLSHKPLTPAERQPLRDSLHRLFAELPVGAFFPVEDFITHATTGARNPLLLGGDATRVVIRKETRVVPPLEEVLEEAGRELVRAVLEQRLIPLGCVQLARDSKRLLLARRPRLDVFFGKAAPPPPAEEAQTRVVVQPDFSVIVIGLNPAPAADLAPFCERVRGRASQGSLTLRITRESVMKALAAGLPPEQVMARLEKHASTALPSNVATEVRGWCGWVRRVSATPATLLRCPDADAAARVMGALGKHAERVGDTIVAVALDGLTSALRQKLQGQGVLVEAPKRRKK